MIKILDALFEIIFNILGSLLESFLKLIGQIFSSKRKTQYDADFISPEKVLHKNGGGFCIGEWSTTILESHSHLICFGGSGSRKSTTIVFNTCLTANDVSLVIHDPSKEIFDGTATALKNLGYTIKVLDYNDPEKSEGFNVLSKCKTDSDIFKIAKVLIGNTLEQSQDFWSQSSEGLIVLMAKYLINYAEPQYRNLSNVLNLINVFSYSPQSVDKLMVKTRDPQLIHEYKSLVATPDKTLLSIVATAKTALAIYGSPDIQKVTSFDTISFEDFRTEKTALYICSSAKDANFFRAISATFFETFFGSILNNIPDKTSSYPIMFLIDEASSMRLNSLSSAVALLRKHAASIALLFQDYSQIEHLYGKYEAANITSNCATRVYMPGQPIETCLTLQTILGKFHYDDEGTQRARELMTAQEIRQLKKSLVLISNKPPVLLDLKPYFEQPRLKRMTELPPFELENKLPFDTPPFIQFDK